MLGSIPSCTFETLIDSLEGWRDLANKDLPLQLSYAVLKVSKQIEEEIKSYSTLRDAIQAKYASDKTNPEMLGEMADLGNLPVDREFELLCMQDLLDAEVLLKPSLLRGLLPFFIE